MHLNSTRRRIGLVGNMEDEIVGSSPIYQISSPSWVRHHGWKQVQRASRIKGNTPDLETGWARITTFRREKGRRETLHEVAARREYSLNRSSWSVPDVSRSFGIENLKVYYALYTWYSTKLLVNENPPGNFFAFRKLKSKEPRDERSNALPSVMPSTFFFHFVTKVNLHRPCRRLQWLFWNCHETGRTNLEIVANTPGSCKWYVTTYKIRIYLQIPVSCSYQLKVATNSVSNLSNGTLDLAYRQCKDALEFPTSTLSGSLRNFYMLKQP